MIMSETEQGISEQVLKGDIWLLYQNHGLVYQKALIRFGSSDADQWP